MANGYRLEQDVIISRARQLVERYAKVADFENFYKEAWNFLFEIRIDLKTATELRDNTRITLYTTSITALLDLVAGIISKHNKHLIEEEFNGST